MGVKARPKENKHFCEPPCFVGCAWGGFKELHCCRGSIWRHTDREFHWAFHLGKTNDNLGSTYVGLFRFVANPPVLLIGSITDGHMESWGVHASMSLTLLDNGETHVLLTWK